MPNSKKSRQKSKPANPYPEFPLTPHPSGRWCKKRNGRLHYFGPTHDGEGNVVWQDALERYKRDWPYILQGKQPPAEDEPERLTVASLCNEFLHAKRQLVNSGELKMRSWKDYETTARKILEVFGRHRAVEDLKPADFDKLRATFAQGKNGRQRGPVSIGGDVRRTRIIFRYAEEAGLTEKRIRVGPHFREPSKKTLRQARQANGERMLEATEIRTLLAEAKQPRRAMILLAINGGLGQSDLANMPQAALDLEAGILDFPRPKTAVPRRIPLWKETAEAVREALCSRPKARDSADEDMAFLTKSAADGRGQRMANKQAGLTASAWSSASCFGEPGSTRKVGTFIACGTLSGPWPMK